MHLTLNDHFKYNDITKVRYGRCNREPLDFRSECVETAKLIDHEHINIFYSGGIDSEVVVNAFIEANVPFACIIHDNGYNEHDIKYALNLCKKFNLIPNILKMDVKHFWKKELYKKSMETKCVSPQFPVIMWMVDQIMGFNILGSGECFLNRELDDSWVMFEREKVATLYKHYEIHNIEGAPGFFQYTPELMLSFLENSIVKNAIECFDFEDSYPLKKMVYHDLWPDMEPRTKYTGFEKLKSLDKKYRNILEKIYPNSNRIYKTEYNRLINQLAPVVIKEVSLGQILQHKSLFEKENMKVGTSIFDEVDVCKYYIAYIRGEVAGFGMLDIFKDKQTVYSHGSLTVPKFRGMGINDILLYHRYDELKKYLDNPLVMVITPHWISGGGYQEKKFLKLGYDYGPQKEGLGLVLSCKLRDIKYD